MKKGDKMASIMVLDSIKSYEVRCKVEDFITSGPLFDKMSEKMKQTGLTVRGVLIFTPVEVFNQSASDEAGTKMA
jgi:hypothetical protein